MLDLPPTRDAFRPAPQRVDVRNWTGAGDAWWSTPGNWDPTGAPKPGEWLQFFRPGLNAVYDLGALSLDRLYAGAASPGATMHHLAGGLSANIFALGINGTSVEYRFGGATAQLVAGQTYVGANGIGSMNVAAGTLAAGNFLSLGDAPTARGRLLLGGGRVSTPELDVGYYGRGTLEMHGGTLLVGSIVAAGFVAGSAGTIQVHGGSVLAPIGIVGLSGSGTLEQSAGVLTFLQFLDLAEDPTSTGFFAKTGGVLTAPEMAVGVNQGKGQFHMSGGTLSIGPLYVNAVSAATFSGGSASAAVLDVEQGGVVHLTHHGIAVADTSNIRLYVLTGRVQALGAVGFDADSLLATIAGDVNLDRAVNIADSSILGANFGRAGEWPQGDMDYDGRVNIADFAILSANWGLTYSAGRTLPEPATSCAAAAIAWALARRIARRRTR